MTVKSNIDKLILSLEKRSARLKPDSPQLQEAFYRIGLRVTTQAKLNVRSQGIINTGRLYNSIKWEWYQNGRISGIQIGSFGIPYAAINEFGGTIDRRQLRAMFANRVGKYKKSENPVITFGKNSEIGRWRKRPYLTPAFKDNRQFILNTLSQVLGLK
jgi:phage gpG-like protein